MRKDIDFSFAVHPLTGDLATKTRGSAIKQSLRNIVLTSFFERGFNTQFGTEVRNSLFENNIAGITAQGMRQTIIQGIENFESQVELIDVEVKDAEEGNTVVVNIYYYELNVNEEQQLTVRF